MLPAHERLEPRDALGLERHERLVHGDVGVAEQLLGGRLAFLAVRVRHADARADVQLVPVDAERFLERAHDPSGDLDGADVG